MDIPESIVVEDFHPPQHALRLAVVTETWPPEVNGVAITLARLVRGLCQRNHLVQLIRPRQGKQEVAQAQDDFSEILLKGLPIPRYPQLKLGLPAKKSLIRAWTLQRPDLVHIATEGPLGWSALQAARHLRLPVSSDFRTNFHSYSQHYGVGWLGKPILAYLRKFHNHTDCTMVPTRAMQQTLRERGFAHLQVVARGVDTQLFSPARRDAALRQHWGAADNTLVLLSAGRLAAEKNLDLVLASYQALQSQGCDVRLVFAGDGPLRASLQKQCPQAVFMGMCDHHALARIYASADLFLFPSLTETFGNVTLEALACGTPVLAFNTAAAAELVQAGRNGWLADPAQPQTFVSQVLQACARPGTLQAMRTQTCESVAALDWQEIVLQVERHFLRLSPQHRGAGV